MPTHIQGPIVILGGGPTGLGAAHLLNLAGFDDWVLYERDDEVGGLSRSFRDDRGFNWDIGGHVVFSHYDIFTRLLDGLLGPDGWFEHQRECWVRVAGRWVPYPFQNNIRHLSREDCARCLEGLIRAALARSAVRPANFAEFISATFGEGIAELFMRPYNRKVWAYDPAKLSAGWIGERVSVPDPIRMMQNVVLEKDDVAWGPNNRFRFPKKGGTGAIWNAIAARLPADRVLLNAEAVEIDTAARQVRFADGRRQRYGTLISTMPLDRLAAVAHRRDWSELAAGLLRSAVHVVGVGLNGKPAAALGTKCWMYFPEPSVPFYRTTHFSHYSPDNVDDIGRHWSLMAEVSESSDKPVNAETVAEETVRGLATAGLIEGPEQVTHTWVRRVEYGYPTPSLGRDEILRRLLPAMQEAGIYSRGRFGAWLYEVGNMDHSFMQGMEVAAHLLHGSAELTVWQPNVVNERHPVLGWDRFRWDKT
jgi:protoporphyrinogen oxidase